MIISCFVRIIRLTAFLWWGVKHCRFAFLCAANADLGKGGGRRSTGSFLSTARLLLFQKFIYSTTPVLSCKNKKRQKNVLSNFLNIDTMFTSHPLLRNHWDSRQHKVRTPAGNAPTAVQVLSLSANRCAEGGTFKRHPCICTLNPISALAWCAKKIPTAFPASGITF